MITFEEYLNREIQLDTEEYGDTVKQLEQAVKFEILYIYNNPKLWELAQKVYMNDRLCKNWEYTKRELNLLKKHNYSHVLVTFENMAVSTIIRYNKYKKKYLDR